MTNDYMIGIAKACAMLWIETASRLKPGKTEG